MNTENNVEKAVFDQQKINQRLAKELKLKPLDVTQTVALLDDGNTVPFIARYRKEMSGSMDDQILRRLEERLQDLRQLEERRADILRLITEQGQLTSALEAEILMAETKTALDDIYRPYRPKRRTRAQAARELGLTVLATALADEGQSMKACLALAETMVQADEGALEDVAACLRGASDILAEELADRADIREQLRASIRSRGFLQALALKKEDSVYRLYYDYREAYRLVKGHRVLALNRGEKEAFLRVNLDMSECEAEHILARSSQPSADKEAFFCEMQEDCWKRLLAPSLENELRQELTAMAEEEAMAIFQTNLKATLLAPPLRAKVVLALDPGYRNGCKVAVTDRHGSVLATAHIFPTEPRRDWAGSGRVLNQLIREHEVEVLALGNGTATRETEAFIRAFLQDEGLKLPLVIVNEAGASVYSASAVAAEELPELDVSLRSAVSLARRLQDPLAELVKIEPAAIGVGQYQHDMNQKLLQSKLAAVVEDCVNNVGCDLNSASPALLAYISGINATLAKNIVAYRMDNGAFARRSELKKVPRLGPKAYEQCAGFLRIPDGEEALDNTSIHPESYVAARVLLKKLGLRTDMLGSSQMNELNRRVLRDDLDKLAQELAVGRPTLEDMIEALEKPGRDNREDLDVSERSSGINDIADLKPGMKLKGVVRNVAAFGAFVDVGVHQDGLVHISELADRYVKDPSTVVRAGQSVDVLVLSVDSEKKRISLSMKRQN